MTCCTPADAGISIDGSRNVPTDDDAMLALSRSLGDGTRQLEFAVPDAHCAACIRSIETCLADLPHVKSARVNLTRRRVRVIFDGLLGQPSALSRTIRESGYHNYALDPADEAGGDTALTELVRSLAVAGFAAGNIMLFSVSVWAGANEASRDLFHWLSAIIALPAIAYAGRVFFRSAWRALRVGKTNMDVPISIGVVLATVLSLYETLRSGEHAYFDASTMLLFFLLIGRTLDHLMRERARSAVANLARLQPRGATIVHKDGRREYLGLSEIEPGMQIELRAGERVPVDCRAAVENGVFDHSTISGETMPRAARAGDPVLSGAVNLAGSTLLIAERRSEESFLARMTAMMEAAEAARTRPRRIADRAAAIYAPVVHALALATFAGWGATTGDWHAALTNAVAVLIITCPCALALAVPIVHVVAAGRLFARGILMKDGAALERIAEVDSVALDKTGTLTLGQPRVVEHRLSDEAAARMAASLAAASTHPLARALAGAVPAASAPPTGVTEVAGQGVECTENGNVWRLGSARWCGMADEEQSGRTTVFLFRNGALAGRFTFEDQLRGDAGEAVGRLTEMNLPVRILSGDSEAAVDRIASEAGIREVRSGMLPEDKAANAATGRTLMVGDGINDAPALRAAYVSMAPSSATDIGRNAADFVFTSNELMAVPFAIDTARSAARLVTQNLILAIGYNVIAVPLAVCGLVTPLIAAVAMSTSSIIVVANAVRLRLPKLAVRSPAAEMPGALVESHS